MPATSRVVVMPQDLSDALAKSGPVHVALGYGVWCCC